MNICKRWPLLLAGGLLLAALLPWIIWTVSPGRPLQVAILDKTVPDASYREHKGLVWLLNQQRYVKNNGSAYDYSRDYYGFHPEDGTDYSVSELPEEVVSADLIYVADTYGVSAADFYGASPPEGAAAHLYGGLTLGDAELLTGAAGRGATLVAEFNAFASPTPPSAAARMYPLLGVRWTGWTGRYFPELGEGGEVPEALRQAYADQEGSPWPYSGPGLLLVHSDGGMLVLEEGRALEEGGVGMTFTPEGRAFSGVKKTIRYNYWFDIVTPTGDSSVLANYRLKVTDEGRAVLTGAGLSAEFPAVVARRTDVYTAYYFAGDYADYNRYPFWRRYTGWETLKSAFTFDRNHSEDAFYWDVYVPLMKAVLKEVYDRKEGAD